MKRRKLTDITGSDVDEVLLDVQMGNVIGAFAIWKFGRNTNVGATETAVWDAGVDYIFPDSASILAVSSSNIADTQAITIQGLDGDYNQIEETITLNGTTPVNTVNTFLRVNRAFNSGSTEHIGDISITHIVSANLIGYINAYAQQSLQANYTVPAGYSMYIFKGMASAGKLKDAQVFFRFRLPGGVFRLSESFGLYQNTYEASRPYSVLPEKTDTKVTAISESAGTDISAQYGFLLIKNDRHS